MRELRLLAVLAHPDDESLGIGGTLAHYAASGVATYLVTATRGQRGRFFADRARPPDDEVGRVRERELRAAADVLGVREVTVLDYLDRELDSAPPREVLGRIVDEVRRIRPHVVVTFGPDGAYGHPDHIAISQYTVGAIVAAADAAFAPETAAHRVAKLYFFGWPAELWALFERVFRKLVSVVDDVERQVTPLPDWLLNTRVDARAERRTVWRAVQCHATQLAIYERLGELTDAEHATLWGEQRFVRVFSSVNGGRARETDLFEGLRGVPVAHA